MAIVTISRLLGSGGDEIAFKVAKGLGYTLVDKTLIAKVAAQAGVSVEDASQFDEKYQSKAVKMLKSIIQPRVGKIIIEEGKHLDPESYVEYCMTVIRGLAEEGNMVIVGRAGQFILNNRDNAFHIRIIADEDFRVEWLKKHHGISDHEAMDMMKKSDSMVIHYIEKYMKADVNDINAYHLIIDSSKIGIDQTISLIVEAVDEFSRTHEYIPGVKDRRSTRERREKKRRKGGRRYESVGWTPKDTQSAVLKDGRQVRTFTKSDRRKVEKRKLDDRRSETDTVVDSTDDMVKS